MPPEIDEFQHNVSPRLKFFASFLIGIFGSLLFAWIFGDLLGSLLNAIQETPLYYLIPFSVSASLFAYLVYKAKVLGIHGLEFLSIFVLAISLSELFKMIAGETLLTTAPYHRGTNVFATLNDMMMPLAVLALYLHVELIENNHPNLLRAIGIFSSGLPLIFGGLLQIILNSTNILETILHFPGLEKEVEDVLTFYLYIFALFILWISVFGLRVMYGTLVHADSAAISRGSQFMIIGFSSLIGNFVLLGVRDTINLMAILSFNLSFTVHTSWLLMGTIIIMYLAYLLSPQFAFSVPFDVYQLIVINREDGVTLFSFINEIRSYNKPAIQVALKSPAIVAIQTLLKEITYAEGVVHLIGMSDRQILLQSQGSVTSVLISEKSSYILNKGLEGYTREFYNRYKNEIENFTGNVGVFKGSMDILRKYFPFFREESL